MVGISGMGEIGKSTIERAIFNRIAYRFEGDSFVENVRENSTNNKGIRALQEKILRDVLRVNYFMIDDLNKGAKLIQARFSKKKKSLF